MTNIRNKLKMNPKERLERRMNVMRNNLKNYTEKHNAEMSVMQDTLNAILQFEKDFKAARAQARKLVRDHDFLHIEDEGDRIIIDCTHPSAFKNGDVNDDYNDDVCPTEARYIWKDTEYQHTGPNFWSEVVETLSAYANAAKMSVTQNN